jgi:hypothetical protein
MEWCDLPPGHAIRQVAADACLGTKLQHFAANHGGWAAMPVTGLTIHDIVISP